MHNSHMEPVATVWDYISLADLRDDISLNTVSNFNNRNTRFIDKEYSEKLWNISLNILGLSILIQNGPLLFKNFFNSVEVDLETK